MTIDSSYAALKLFLKMTIKGLKDPEAKTRALKSFLFQYLLIYILF